MYDKSEYAIFVSEKKSFGERHTKCGERCHKKNLSSHKKYNVKNVEFVSGEFDLHFTERVMSDYVYD